MTSRALTWRAVACGPAETALDDRFHRRGSADGRGGTGLPVPPLLRARVRMAGASGSDANLSVYRHQFRELEADRNAGVVSAAAFDESRLELERRLSTRWHRSVQEAGRPRARRTEAWPS